MILKPSFHLLLLLLINVIEILGKQEQVVTANALRGRTYFEKKMPLTVKGKEAQLKGKTCKFNKEQSSGSSESRSGSNKSSGSCDSSDSCTTTTSSESTESANCSMTASTISSGESNQISAFSASDPQPVQDSSSNSLTLSSSSSTSTSVPLRPRLVPRVDYQRPWCPGIAMASLASQAMDIIYDWRNPQTCQQFADNYGGVSVLVGELGGPDLCSAGPSIIYSNYTITRAMSINEPVYARVKQSETGIEFAAAAGPIFYPEGLVLYISVAKEVAKLPQVCTK